MEELSDMPPGELHRFIGAGIEGGPWGREGAQLGDLPAREPRNRFLGRLSRLPCSARQEGLASAPVPLLKQPCPHTDLVLADEALVRVGLLDGPGEYLFSNIRGRCQAQSCSPEKANGSPCGVLPLPQVVADAMDVCSGTSPTHSTPESFIPGGGQQARTHTGRTFRNHRIEASPCFRVTSSTVRLWRIPFRRSAS